MFSLRTFINQIAVITGAGSGIGRAIALSLAAENAKLCLVGRQLETLEAVAMRARNHASIVKCYRADLALDEDINALAKDLKREFGHIDVLVHSAGVISLGRLESAPVADLDWQYRINVRAPYVLTQALLPMLILRQGQIVFINSSAGVSATANVGQYSATKFALRAIADSLRQEINAKGVRVLSVYPGRTAGPMQESVHKMEGKAYHPERLMQPEDVAAMVIQALSLPRSAEVTEIFMRPMSKA
jgi:NADP-dependent 3-hydroxy acid dehydrogenase YdfG